VFDVSPALGCWCSEVAAANWCVEAFPGFGSDSSDAEFFFFVAFGDKESFVAFFFEDFCGFDDGKDSFSGREVSVCCALGIDELDAADKPGFACNLFNLVGEPGVESFDAGVFVFAGVGFEIREPHAHVAGVKESFDVVFRVFFCFFWGEFFVVESVLDGFLSFWELSAV